MAKTEVVEAVQDVQDVDGTQETEEVQAAREAAEADAAFRAQIDSLLKEAQSAFQAEAEKHSYTLAQLTGAPQPYEPIPGLFFTRPKMGRKMEVSRRFDVIQANYRVDLNDDKATADNIALLMPYMHVEGQDGALRHPTAQEVMYEIFDDAQELVDFYLHIMTSRRAAKAEAEGNA